MPYRRPERGSDILHSILAGGPPPTAAEEDAALARREQAAIADIRWRRERREERERREGEEALAWWNEQARLAPCPATPGRLA